jgi:hypothetical protein
MKRILLILIVFAFSCSTGDNNSEENNNDIITLEVNNVYVEDPVNNDWVDVIVTDGVFTQSSTDDVFYPDDNTTYIIHFLELQLDGDFSTPNVYENLYDANLDQYTNQGTEGVIFYIDMVVENGEYISSTDLFDLVGYVKFTLISENNFTFYIEMIDGRIFKGSYSGNVNILDQEYGFVPDIYWTGG